MSMKPRTVFFLVLLFLIALFAALNWSVFNTPAKLSFLVGHAEAPLGVLLLAVIGALCVLFLLLLARIETTALLDGRRGFKELEKARKLAEGGEDSRYEQLREQLDDGLDRLHEKLDELMDRIKLPSGNEGGDGP